MARRRMFSQDVVWQDNFLDMPSSTRLLYFDLGMAADDDGFASPKKVMRLSGANEDDLKILVAKQYVIPFESGVIVIKNWKENNYIQKDRYTPTTYRAEKALLGCDNNVYILDTQVGRLELGKKEEKVESEENLKKIEDKDGLNNAIQSARRVLTDRLGV